MMEKVRLKPQGRSFIKAARELGCDEDESHFEEKLRKVAGRKGVKACAEKSQRKEQPK